MEMKGNKVRLNMTLKAGSHHCLFGSWAEKVEESNESPVLLGPSIETDRFLRLLPKYQTPSQWQLFGKSTELWFVQCYEPRYVFYDHCYYKRQN